MNRGGKRAASNFSEAPEPGAEGSKTGTNYYD